MVFNYCIHIAYFILYIDKIFCFLVSDNNQNVVLLYTFTNSLNNFMHLIILVTPYFVNKLFYYTLKAQLFTELQCVEKIFCAFL